MTSARIVSATLAISSLFAQVNVAARPLEAEMSTRRDKAKASRKPAALGRWPTKNIGGTSVSWTIR